MDQTSNPVESWRQTVERALVSHENQLTQLDSRLSQQQPETPDQAPDPSPKGFIEPRIPPPERYGGELGGSRPFLTQCELVFELQPSAFPSDRAKVAYALSLLTGRPKKWAAAEWSRRAPCCSSFQDFSTELKKVFDPVNPEEEAANTLLRLTQGPRPVIDYIIDFRSASADCGWGEQALVDVFRAGLSVKIKDSLVMHDKPKTLQEFIALVTKIDSRLQERQLDRARFPQGSYHSPAGRRVLPAQRPVVELPSYTPPVLNAGEPMQLGRAKLTPEEKQRRFRMNLCLYCGGPGHRALGCPVKDSAQQGLGGHC